MGELQISVCQLDQLESLVRWIHADLPLEERQLKLDEASTHFASDSRLSPLEANLAATRIAGVYLLPLPGRVATLGGVRSMEAPSVAVILLRHSIEQAYRRGMEQVQAIARVEDPHTPLLLKAADFEHLTDVSHLWLDMTAAHSRRSERVTPAADASLSWQSVQPMSQTEFARFINRTFEDSLDCPQLNGIRSEADVLTGFLDGRQFDQISHWYLLGQSDRAAGCALLNQHSQQVVELCYMGLIPEYRGRQLGVALVQKAIAEARGLGATILVAAVDEKNWPALRIYREFGFEHHRSLAVWLHARHARYEL